MADFFDIERKNHRLAQWEQHYRWQSEENRSDSSSLIDSRDNSPLYIPLWSRKKLHIHCHYALTSKKYAVLLRQARGNPLSIWRKPLAWSIVFLFNILRGKYSRIRSEPCQRTEYFFRCTLRLTLDTFARFMISYMRNMRAIIVAVRRLCKIFILLSRKCGYRRIAFTVQPAYISRGTRGPVSTGKIYYQHCDIGNVTAHYWSAHFIGVIGVRLRIRVGRTIFAGPFTTSRWSNVVFS